jgi:hypothetical protein
MTHAEAKDFIEHPTVPRQFSEQISRTEQMYTASNQQALVVPAFPNNKVVEEYTAATSASGDNKAVLYP